MARPFQIPNYSAGTLLFSGPKQLVDFAFDHRRQLGQARTTDRHKGASQRGHKCPPITLPRFCPLDEKSLYSYLSLSPFSKMALTHCQVYHLLQNKALSNFKHNLQMKCSPSISKGLYQIVLQRRNFSIKRPFSSFACP